MERSRSHRNRPPSLRTRRIGSSGRVMISAPKEDPRVEEYADLSLGGLFVKTLAPEDKGTKLRIDLQLMGLRLRAPGRVVWTRPVPLSDAKPAGMGVAFDQLSPNQKKLLYKQISHSLKHGASVLSGTPPSGNDSDATRSSSSGLRSLLGRFRS